MLRTDLAINFVLVIESLWLGFALPPLAIAGLSLADNAHQSETLIPVNNILPATFWMLLVFTTVQFGTILTVVYAQTVKESAFLVPFGIWRLLTLALATTILFTVFFHTDLSVTLFGAQFNIQKSLSVPICFYIVLSFFTLASLQQIQKGWNRERRHEIPIPFPLKF